MTLSTPQPGDDKALVDRFRQSKPGGNADAFRAWARKQRDVAADEATLQSAERILRQRALAERLLEPGTEPAHLGSVFGRRGTKEEAEPAPAPEPQSLSVGRTIGSFRLTGFIARGGMGQVWEAYDEELRRSVALKLVLPERIDARSLELFAREARAGGRVSHPNLVTTLGYGTDDGLSWIAQELVPGSWTLKDSLDEVRSQERVPKGYYREVAGLIAKVADGMQAAHEAGVIHRDLKPQNILIAEDDAPKVTDFGLARVTDESVMSKSGELVGTWAYMSPEQVTAKRKGLDGRSDVFSLGAVLYELLTLQRPFQGDTTHQIASQIIAVDPPEADRIRSQCPRELAVVCGKALEKEPNRRYASMADLASDLRRYLADEPVLAKPPTAFVRASKWASRHPAVTAAVAIGVLALVIVSLLSLTLASTAEKLRGQSLIARDNKRLAEERAIQLEATAEELRGQTQMGLQQRLAGLDPASMGLFLRQGLREKLRKREERSGRSGEEIEAFLLEYDSWIVGVDFTGLGLDALAAQILEPALQEIEQGFEGEPRVKAGLLQAVATTATELGLLDLAEAPQREALETRRRELGDEDPETIISMNGMGYLLQKQGKLSEAEPYFREGLEASRRVLGDEDAGTFDLMSSLGSLLLSQGKLSEAEPHVRAALAGRRRLLGNEHPSTLISIHDMGALLQAQGKLSEAERYDREGLEASRRVLGDEHPSTLIAINDLSALLRVQGKLSEAEPYAREALEGSRRVLGDEHPNTLLAINNLGSLLKAQGKLSEAETYDREGLETSRRVLGDEHPGTLTLINNLGGLLRARGKLSEAEPYVREALEGRRRVLGSEHPDTLTSINDMAALLRDQGDLSVAETSDRMGLEASRQVLGDEHPNTLTLSDNLGSPLRAQGKLAEAEPYAREALEGRRRVLGGKHPATLTSIENLVALLRDQGKPSEAEPYSREALETSRELLGHDHPTAVSNLRVRLAILVDLQRLDEARALAAEFLATTDYAEEHPLRVDVQGLLDGMDTPTADEGG